jgi:hypothetical protein
VSAQEVPRTQTDSVTIYRHLFLFNSITRITTFFPLSFFPAYSVDEYFSKADKIDGAVSSVQHAVQTAAQKRFLIFEFLESTCGVRARPALVSSQL